MSEYHYLIYPSIIFTLNVQNIILTGFRLYEYLLAITHLYSEIYQISFYLSISVNLEPSGPGVRKIQSLSIIFIYLLLYTWNYQILAGGLLH